MELYNFTQKTIVITPSCKGYYFTAPKARKIDELLENLQAGALLLVSELSRLGRSVGQIIQIVDTLAPDRFENELNLYFLEEGGIGWKIGNGKLEARNPEDLDQTIRFATSALAESGNQTAQTELHRRGRSAAALRG